MALSDPQSTIAGSEARTRLVQRGGRRYSIRLEQVFWRSLEEAASELGVRLNELVAQIAEAQGGPDNLASRLRMFCLSHLRDELVGARIATGGTDVTKVVLASPAPCFVVSPRRLVTHANPAFEALFGGRAHELIGQPLEKSFRLNFGTAMSAFWSDLSKPDCPPLAGRLSFMLPGRVFVAPITACPVARTDAGAVSCLVFVRRSAR